MSYAFYDVLVRQFAVLDLGFVCTSFEELLGASRLDESSWVSDGEEAEMRLSTDLREEIFSASIPEMGRVSNGGRDRSCVVPVLDDLFAERCGEIDCFVSVEVFGVGVLVWVLAETCTIIRCVDVQ